MSGCSVCGREYGLMVVVQDGKRKLVLCRQCAGLTEPEWVELCEQFKHAVPLPEVKLAVSTTKHLPVQITVPFRRSRQNRRSQR